MVKKEVGIQYNRYKLTIQSWQYLEVAVNLAVQVLTTVVNNDNSSHLPTRFARLPKIRTKAIHFLQRRSSRPPNPPIGGPRPTLGAQVSLKLLFGYVTIFSSVDLFTTDLNCRKKLACDIISECNVILSRRI